MHKSFIISEEERKRILGIHENATKKQYLKEADASVNASNQKWVNYPCVTRHSSAKKQTMASGLIVYEIGSVAYYPDGQRTNQPWERSGEFYNFSCTDDTFKIDVEEKWKKYPCVTGHPKAERVEDNTTLVAYKIGEEVFYANGRKSDKNNTMVNYSCEDAMFKKSGTVGKGIENPSQCPVGSGTTEEVKAFQDWLDINAKGWLPKLPDGLNKDPKKGYGRCGPNTRRAWEKNKLLYSVRFDPSKIVHRPEDDDVVVPEEPKKEVNNNQAIGKDEVTIKSTSSSDMPEF